MHVSIAPPQREAYGRSVASRGPVLWPAIGISEPNRRARFVLRRPGWARGSSLVGTERAVSTRSQTCRCELLRPWERLRASLLDPLCLGYGALESADARAQSVRRAFCQRKRAIGSVGAFKEKAAVRKSGLKGVCP
jgi:hypothetical protein